MKSSTQIKRPALRYYGGKWRMAPKIISHFVPHKIYLEPFFGGGSILLRKQRSRVETVNDLDDQVTNYFQVLRDNSTELITALKLTPWSIAELQKSPRDTDDPIEQARLFFLHCWATIAQNENHLGFRVSKKSSSNPSAIMQQLNYLYEVSNRMQGVQIDKLDAVSFIEKYASNETLIYLDPPYTKNERAKKNEYFLEGSDGLHERIINSIKGLSCPVFISGYENPLYDRELSDWRKIKFIARNNSGSKGVEVLWTNTKNNLLF